VSQRESAERGPTGVRRALAASVAAHVVLFVALRGVDADRPAKPPRVQAPAIAIEVVPMDVVLATPESEKPAIASAKTTVDGVGDGRGRRAPRRDATVTGRSGSTETAAVTPPPTSVEPPAIRLGPSSTFIDEFLENSKPLPPRPDIPGERIGDEIADLRAKLSDPDWTSRASPDELAAARIALVGARAARDAEELEPAGGGRYRADKDTFIADVEPDGSVDLNDTKNLQIYGLHGRFDVTDWAMRSAGQDPYAAAKQRFLERTFDQRVALGERHRKRQLAKSAHLMQKNVERLWRKTTDLAARKEGLFELWDECAEHGDPDLVAGGEAARRYVLGVIRARLRGANAYTADEIARFDARRRSKQRFAPY
jgi:hypothetical protein